MDEIKEQTNSPSRALAHRVDRGFSAVAKQFGNGDERVIEFIASTDSIDRYDDSIKQDGWKLDNYKANPVVLYVHDNRSLPVGKAIDVRVEDNQLVVAVQFATAEEYEMAETVYRLVRGGYLNAVSVGFRPLKWAWVEDKTNGRAGYDILESELLEISIVPVPANQEALRKDFAGAFGTIIAQEHRAVEVPLEMPSTDKPAQQIQQRKGLSIWAAALRILNLKEGM